MIGLHLIKKNYSNQVENALINVKGIDKSLEVGYTKKELENKLLNL